MNTSTRTNVVHSLRVAAAATAIVASLYLVAVVAFDVIVVHRLISQVDGRLSDRLSDTVRNPGILHSGPVVSKNEPGTSGTSTDLDDRAGLRVEGQQHRASRGQWICCSGFAGRILVTPRRHRHIRGRYQLVSSGCDVL